MSKLRDIFFRRSDRLILALILIGILAIAFLVQQKLAFLNFFFLPVILAGYFLGQRQAVLVALSCILLIVLYLVFGRLIGARTVAADLDTILNLVTWGSFLILTGALMGGLTEQREQKIRQMRAAYVGVLEVALKYLEVADDTQPRSVRISHLAGKIARTAGLERREVENIKSAALLAEAGDLRSSVPLFTEVSRSMAEDPALGGSLGSRDQVTLRTTASLLMEVSPILAAYFKNYVDEAGMVDKDLAAIPPGSSIIALADLYDRLTTTGSATWGTEIIRSWGDLEALSGRAFPATTVQAVREVDRKSA
jgi:hypothetical protein